MPLLTLLISGVIGVASQLEAGRSLFRRHTKRISFVAVFLVFGLAAIAAWEQYNTWQHDPVARFLIPPYKDLNYFLLYSFGRFFGPYLVSLFAGTVFLALTLALNRKRGGRFFEREEPYLVALSFFLTGHPGWLIYLAAVILIYLLIHTLFFARGRRNERLPLYQLWAPVAFFVILLNEYWLSHTHFWALLSL